MDIIYKLKWESSSNYTTAINSPCGRDNELFKELFAVTEPKVHHHLYKVQKMEPILSLFKLL